MLKGGGVQRAHHEAVLQVRGDVGRLLIIQLGPPRRKRTTGIQT